ncbi:iron chaperone [Actinoplanes sp. G11-F43]|uniref:iron chaperone n=1 Tax=Actinoplanes sp. G11-F43 TaxID=3424130 RepID=UPI003D35423A
MASEDGFSAAERAAIKERATELKTAGRRGKAAEKAAAEAQDVLDKIAAMPEPDRGLAEGLHALVTGTVPELAPKLWYGQPAYARNGKVLCFFRSGLGDKERYSTFGFSSAAKLDTGHGLWATSFALTELTDQAAAEIRELLLRALA